MKIYLFLIPIFLSFSWANSKNIYVYHRLYMKNVEQMERMIYKKISQSRSQKNKRTHFLKEAAQILFSRPDHDKIIHKLFPLLWGELQEYNQIDKVLNSLIDEAFNCLHDRVKNCSDQAQVTYLIALENLLDNTRIYLDKNEIKKIFQKISDKDIKITKEAKKSAFIHMSIELKNPSELAKKFLDKFEESKNEIKN